MYNREKYLFFVHGDSRSTTKYMSNSIKFYKEIFLYQIPIRL